MKMLILMGLPASGKSLCAAEHQAADPAGWAIVSKDAIRKQSPPPEGKFTLDYEHRVVIPTEEQAIRAAVLHGENVVVDSTNFAHEARLRRLAKELHLEVEVHFLNTQIETCIQRDALRLPGNRVGERVIRNMAWLFQDTILEHTLLPYHNPPNLPEAIIVDIDGTLTLPLQPTVVNEPVAKLIRREWIYGLKVIVVTSRSESERQITGEFLTKNQLFFHSLYMRPLGDDRRDNFFKLWVFDTYLRNKLFIRYCLEDRLRCVRMYRALGLTCFQVNEGDV